MKRRLRLRQRADFAALRQEGRRLVHPLTILVIRPNGLERSRFGFSASRRVGRSTQRNRAKRLFREAVRLHLRHLDNGWDCLFIIRAPAVTATLKDIETSVKQLFSRAGMVSRPEN